MVLSTPASHYTVNIINLAVVCLSGKYKNVDIRVIIRHSLTSHEHFNFTGNEVVKQCWYLNDDVSERW